MAEIPEPGSEAARSGAIERKAAADPATMAKLQDFLAVDRDLPETSVRMRYLILSQARTGGTLLCEALQRSGHAGLPFEYLNPAAIKFFLTRLDIRQGITLRRLLAELQKRRTGPNGVFGLLVHFEQLTKPFKTIEEIGKWAHQFDRLVMLYRRDKLAQAISLERSIQSSVWFQAPHETGERNPPEWTFDPWTIARHVANFGQQEQQIRAALATYPGRLIELTYEELDQAFETAWHKVSKFLDVPPTPVAKVFPPLARMRDAASEEMTERFLAALRDSDLARDPAFARLAGSGRTRR